MVHKVSDASVLVCLLLCVCDCRAQNNSSGTTLSLLLHVGKLLLGVEARVGL